jgi:DNA-binding winged helix-turn-helix (wHTH) protein
VTVGILADREPYASYPGRMPSRGGLLPCRDLALDSLPPDIVVLPAADFLALPRRGHRPLFLAYGPVSLMESAFERGCADYLREPWPFEELVARLGRLERPVSRIFRSDGELYRLEGPTLSAGKGTIRLDADGLSFLLLLLRNAPFPVTREAAKAAVPIAGGDSAAALKRSVASLRRGLESLSPELAHKFKSVRGIGYRFDVELCG